MPPPASLRLASSSAAPSVEGVSKGAVSTRERILDAAERLFIQHGFEATTLRLITAEAAVNLAAVNYHFGSKEDLVREVLTRRLDQLNAHRLELLAELETQPSETLKPEAILRAMFLPALRIARDQVSGGEQFLRLIGRAYIDPAPFIRTLLSEQYAPMIARFKAAFAKALPHLGKTELSLRLHFVMGALSYALAGNDTLRLLANISARTAHNDELVLQKLAPFLVAGLQAPASD